MEVGDDVHAIAVGDFVVGSFFASDITCEICRSGYQTGCVHRQPGAPTGAQAECARIPLADGTYVATPGQPDTLPLEEAARGYEAKDQRTATKVLLTV